MVMVGHAWPLAAGPSQGVFGLDDPADLLYQGEFDLGIAGPDLALMVRDLRDDDDEDGADFYCHAPRSVGVPRLPVLGDELQPSPASSESGAGVIGTKAGVRGTESEIPPRTEDDAVQLDTQDEGETPRPPEDGTESEDRGTVTEIQHCTEDDTVETQVGGEPSRPPDDDRGIGEPTRAGIGDGGQDDRVLTLPPPVAGTATHEAEPPPDRWRGAAPTGTPLRSGSPSSKLSSS
jgi:hypothetical protein